MVKNSGKLYGISMILSFLSYAIGMGLMDIINTSALQPSQIPEERGRIIIGGILVVLVHSVCNVLLLMVMFKKLFSFHKRLSQCYLGTGLLATAILAVGGICMLLPVSPDLSTDDAVAKDPFVFNALVSWSSKMNFYAYQTGMFIWGIGGLIFCYLLNKSNLVPLVFPIWGCIGYLVFITGTIFELCGLPLGVLFSIPGGLFEMILSVWLIRYGFSNRVPG